MPLPDDDPIDTELGLMIELTEIADEFRDIGLDDFAAVLDELQVAHATGQIDDMIGRLKAKQPVVMSGGFPH